MRVKSEDGEECRLWKCEYIWRVYPWPVWSCIIYGLSGDAKVNYSSSSDAKYSITTCVHLHVQIIHYLVWSRLPLHAITFADLFESIYRWRNKRIYIYTVFTRTIRASNNSRCAAKLFSFSNNLQFQRFNHHSGTSACNFVAVRLSRWGEFSWPAYWPLLCSCLPWSSRCCAARTREFPSRQH